MNINILAQLLSEYAKKFGDEEKLLLSSAIRDEVLLSLIKSLREDLDMVSLWLVSDARNKDFITRLARIKTNISSLIMKTQPDQKFLSDAKKTYKGIFEKIQTMLNEYEKNPLGNDEDEEEESLAIFKRTSTNPNSTFANNADSKQTPINSRDPWKLDYSKEEKHVGYYVKLNKDMHIYLRLPNGSPCLSIFSNNGNLNVYENIFKQLNLEFLNNGGLYVNVCLIDKWLEITTSLFQNKLINNSERKIIIAAMSHVPRIINQELSVKAKI